MNTTPKFPQRWYLIFVRPAGSKVWTQHTKSVDGGNWIPWTHSNALVAAEEARRVFMHSGWSVNVIDIDHEVEMHDDQELTFSEETFEKVVTMENASI